MESKDTGIVRDDVDDVALNADAAEPSVEESGRTPVANGETAAGEAAGADPAAWSPEEAPSAAESTTDCPADVPTPSAKPFAPAEEKAYTQSQVDALLKRCREESQEEVNRHMEQASKCKAEADDYKARCSRSDERAKRKDAFWSGLSKELNGRGNYSIDMGVFLNKMFQLERFQESDKENEDLSKNLQAEREKCKKANSDCARLTEEKCRLEKEKDELAKRFGELSDSLESVRREGAETNRRLSERQEELEGWKMGWGRLVDFMTPTCLKDKPWFLELSSELQNSVFADPPSDAAMLLLASLAELAVIERSPAGPCFEWKKQLSDIGLVAAIYMHQKKSAEGDVLKMLRDFAQAFQEMPVLKKLKILCWIPDLGGDFPTDKVKHKNNGAMIAKVHNWCITEDGHVYCKALVE